MTTIAQHWIGGEWVDSEHHGDSVNPATGEIIGRYAQGGVAEAPDRRLRRREARRAIRSPKPSLFVLDMITSDPYKVNWLDH